MPTGDLRDHCALRVGFRHDVCLGIVAPTTVPNPSSQCVNNIRNHAAIRSLHNGKHIAGQFAHNKVGDDDRLPYIAQGGRCYSEQRMQYVEEIARLGLTVASRRLHP
ncbi:hypothetical protein MTX20_37770 [Bradyrhizobium sp. ISRA435]|nr:hypothetical protein MTX20_37770 [Bradyrhizobium sp. ISRA435]